jgi:hypothetical protein
MSKREIPRGLRDVADLLKHPAINQEVKQQLLAQLSPEDLVLIGYKPPKLVPSAPVAQPATHVEPLQATTPPPLKLVTSWPVEARELEREPCNEEGPAQEPIAVGYSTQFQLARLNGANRWGGRLFIEIVLIWPLVVIVVAVLMALTIATQELSYCSIR